MLLDSRRNNFEAKIVKEIGKHENGTERMDKNEGKKKGPCKVKAGSFFDDSKPAAKNH